jgi:thiol-disulfide isomerase/thioredoxin
MKSIHRPVLAAFFFAVLVSLGAAEPPPKPPEASAPPAGEPAPAPLSPLKADLVALLEKIDAKLKNGPVPEAALAEELAGFDQLLSKHKDAAPEESVMVLFYKAMLYAQVFENFDQAARALQKIKTDFPQAPQIPQVDEFLDVLAKQQAAVKIQQELEPGKRFPDFEEKTLTGETISVAKYKGSVVLIDFWATWCGPCIEDMPKLIALHKKYGPLGLQIIGVSLDREAEALNKYLAEKQITWPQIFDGKFWDSKLAQKYGVTGIPFTLLINGDGVIAGRNLRGPELEAAIAKLLGP